MIMSENYRDINKSIEYQLFFANQSIYSTIKYRLVRETKMYVFLEEIREDPRFIFRVHKNTLNVQGIKMGENGYKWNIPQAIKLQRT